MTTAALALKPSLETLPIGDRAELAQFLLVSLDEETDSDADAAWDAELTRRHEEILSGKVTGIPAATVFAEIRARHA